MVEGGDDFTYLLTYFSYHIDSLAQTGTRTCNGWDYLGWISIQHLSTSITITVFILIITAVAIAVAIAIASQWTYINTTPTAPGNQNPPTRYAWQTHNPILILILILNLILKIILICAMAGRNRDETRFTRPLALGPFRHVARMLSLRR